MSESQDNNSFNFPAHLEGLMRGAKSLAERGIVSAGEAAQMLWLALDTSLGFQKIEEAKKNGEGE